MKRFQESKKQKQSKQEMLDLLASFHDQGFGKVEKLGKNTDILNYNDNFQKFCKKMLIVHKESKDFSSSASEKKPILTDQDIEYLVNFRKELPEKLSTMQEKLETLQSVAAKSKVNINTKDSPKLLHNMNSLGQAFSGEMYKKILNVEMSNASEALRSSLDSINASIANRSKDVDELTVLYGTDKSKQTNLLHDLLKDHISMQEAEGLDTKSLAALKKIERRIEANSSEITLTKDEYVSFKKNMDNISARFTFSDNAKQEILSELNNIIPEEKYQTPTKTKASKGNIEKLSAINSLSKLSSTQELNNFRTNSKGVVRKKGSASRSKNPFTSEQNQEKKTAQTNRKKVSQNLANEALAVAFSRKRGARPAELNTLRRHENLSELKPELDSQMPSNLKKTGNDQKLHKPSSSTKIGDLFSDNEKDTLRGLGNILKSTPKDLPKKEDSAKEKKKTTNKGRGG